MNNVCENKDYEELYIFEYTWIIRNFENNEDELKETDVNKISRYEVSSTKFVSHNGNYEWCLNLIHLELVYDEDHPDYNSGEGPGPDSDYKFYMDITCNNLTNNFNVFQEKKIEILIDSVDKRFPSVNAKGSVNSKDYSTRIYLYRSYALDKSAGLTNERGDLTIVFRITEPFSTAINTREALKLSCDYALLLKSGEHSDFKIVIEEKEFLVHKNILSARSDYFSAMFKHGTKEQARNMIEISDVRHEVMSKILQYIYCANVRIEEDLMYDLLTAADMYQMNDLKEKCEESIINLLRIHNVGECMVYAERYNNECLKIATIDFLSKHASEFSEADVTLLKSNLTTISSPFVTDLICRSLFLNKGDRFNSSSNAMTAAI